MYNKDLYGFFADRKERILKKTEDDIHIKIARCQAEQEEDVFVDNGGEVEDLDELNPLP